MDTQVQQFLCKVQSTPGSVEALAAADGKTRIIYGAVPDYKPERTELDLARSVTGPSGAITGKKPMSIDVSCYAVSPDTPASDSLEFAALLEASGLAVTQVKRIAIGAITSGPVPRNATVTGGTSGGTGRVVIPAVNGDSYIYYVPISGSLESGETLSFTGGASATSSAGPANHGWTVSPAAPGDRKVVSCRLEEDGMLYTMRDAVAHLTTSVEDGKAEVLQFAFQGARSSISAASLTSSVSFATKKPPALIDAACKIGTFDVPLNTAQLDLRPTIAMRNNASKSDDTGLNGARIVQLNPLFTLGFEAPLASAWDLYAAVDSGAALAVQYRVGSAAGNTVWTFIDAAEPMEPSLSDMERIRHATLSFLCTSHNGRAFEKIFV